ncbi:MAG: hypothetical protein ACFFDF_01430 [Candidatus Odinarchaeota archaeon]
MGRILRDIWILTESGLTVFSRVLDPKMGPQVFGGLMSALNTFAESLVEGGISKFEISHTRYIVVKKNHFLFVANTSNEIKNKKSLSELKKISKRFFEVYPEDIIKNFGVNIKKFASFKNYINNSLEE